MQEFIGSHSISNEIRMLRSAFSGIFLIVEGDIDKRVYQNFIESKDCQIKIAYNKQKAIETIKILNADQTFTGAVIIIDADFEHLEEIKEDVKNCFLTDFHDLECLIFVSPALEKVLAEFGSEEKINSFGKNVREYLFDIGSFVGYLRWISLSDELNLTFEGLDFGKFINKDNLNLDLNSLVTTVKNKSIRPEIDNAQITQQINNLASKNHDKKQVACGKDLVEIFSLGLQKVWGTKSKENPIDSDRIGQGLRLAYEFEFFVSTNLYQSVKMWENENTPFKVFR